jgi:hypothetical protein
MDTLLWVFALLGFWQLVTWIWRWLLSFGGAPPEAGVLFLVKDNEETVEGLFRQLARDCHFRNLCPATGKVMVFDLGSQDQTPAILRLLARESGFLHLREIPEAQVGQAMADLGQNTLVLDLRVLSARRALVLARRFLAGAFPPASGELAGQTDE